jgi:hypothetical protein
MKRASINERLLIQSYQAVCISSYFALQRTGKFQLGRLRHWYNHAPPGNFGMVRNERT